LCFFQRLLRKFQRLLRKKKIKKNPKVLSFQKKGVTVGVGGTDPGNHMN